MNYVLLANPDDWTEYNPNDFDKKEKVCYEIHRKNAKYLSNAIPGEKALLLITGKEQVVKFEAVVSSWPQKMGNKDEVEFTYVRTFEPFNIDFLKIHPEVNKILFSKTGSLKQNSVFAIDDFLYNEIINIVSSDLRKYYGIEESRKFFDESIRRIYADGENNMEDYPKWEFLLRRFNPYKDNQYVDNFEGVVKINSLAQLKSYNNKEYKQDIGKLKDILGRYVTKQLYENIELEKVAYYKSYHDYNFEYGIYFNFKVFTNYIISTESLLNKRANSNLDYKTVRDICFEEVLQHERFHYLTELFITFEELASDNSLIYKNYMNIYRNTFGTDDCLAETLANYFSKMWFIYKGKKKYVGELNTMFSSQAPGYRVAKDIDETNEIDKFNTFERQLKLGSPINNYFNASVMFKEISEFYLKGRLPLAQLEINSKINIPIYIVNDGMKTDDFISLIKIVFPKI